MNLRDMVRHYLRTHGADGLCCWMCGCGVDDLMPCDQPGIDCVAARRVENCTCERYGSTPHRCFEPIVGKRKEA